MSRRGHFEKVRIASGIMGVMLLFFVLFSSFYLAAEAGHECTGHDCPVCAGILQCENTLRQIGSGVAVKIVAAVSVICFLLQVTVSLYELLQETPVTRKVRLNN